MPTSAKRIRIEVLPDTQTIVIRDESCGCEVIRISDVASVGWGHGSEWNVVEISND